MKGGEKTFHHCRNFPYHFPTLPRVLTLQMCAKGQGRRESPYHLPLSGWLIGLRKSPPSIRPLAFTFPHPISACHLFPSEGKNRTAGRGNYRTARRSGGESILSLLSPKKHFLGSPLVAQFLSPSPPPPPRPVQSRRSMGRCEGCFVRVRLSGVVRSMTHPPLPTYPPSHPLHPMPSVLKGLRSTFAIS